MYHIVHFFAVQVTADCLPLLSTAFRSKLGHCCPQAIAGYDIQVTADHYILIVKVFKYKAGHFSPLVSDGGVVHVTADCSPLLAKAYSGEEKHLWCTVDYFFSVSFSYFMSISKKISNTVV